VSNLDLDQFEHYALAAVKASRVAGEKSTRARAMVQGALIMAIVLSVLISIMFGSSVPDFAYYSVQALGILAFIGFFLTDKLATYSVTYRQALERETSAFNYKCSLFDNLSPEDQAEARKIEKKITCSNSYSI